MSREGSDARVAGVSGPGTEPVKLEVGIPEPTHALIVDIATRGGPDDLGTAARRGKVGFALALGVGVLTSCRAI